jgi:hypothetical protein
MILTSTPHSGLRAGASVVEIGASAGLVTPRLAADGAQVVTVGLPADSGSLDSRCQLARSLLLAHLSARPGS